MPQRQVRILIGLAAGILVMLVVIAIVLVRGNDEDTVVSSVAATTAAPAATTVPPSTAVSVPATEAPLVVEPAPTTTPPPTTTTPAPATTAPPPATTTPPPTAPRATTATTAVPPQTDPPPPGPCAGVDGGRPLPDEATDQTWTTADFDMDGVEETMRIYFDPSFTKWFARVEYPDGWSTEVVLDDANHGQIAGWATFRDQRLLLAEIRRDADAVSTYMFVDYRNCNIAQVKGSDGWNFEVEAGRVWDGTVLRSADALRCDADGITLTKVRPGDPGGTGWPYDYQVSSTKYTWDGSTFVEGLEISAALCCDLPAQERVVMEVGGVDC